MIAFSLLFQKMANERFGLQLSLFQQPNQPDANVDATETSNDEEETLSEEFKKRPSTELVGFKEEQRTSPRTMLNNEEKGQSAQRLSPEDSFKRRRSASKGEE